MNKQHPPITRKRAVMFLLGVFVVGAGVSMITKAGLGTSAITSFSYVLSLAFPPSMGTFVFLVNAGMFLAELWLLRREFHPALLLQLPATVLFSASIDTFVALLDPLRLETYPQQLLFLLVSCVVFGAGIALEVTADVIVLPAEALIAAISKVTGRNFGTIKTVVDIAAVAAACLISWRVFGEIRGVREGTLITALTVGTISRFFLALLKRI